MEEPQNQNIDEPQNNNQIENSDAAGIEENQSQNNNNNTNNNNNVSSNNKLTSSKNLNEKLDFSNNSENLVQNMEMNGDMEGGGETADEENEDLFEGDYEEYEEKSLYGDPEYTPQIIEDFSSIVTNRRNELFKIIITRQKREFEAPVNFNDKGPGEEGNGNNSEFKQVTKATEFPCADRAVLEMGFQTSNEAYEKSYQVPRMRMQNALTQVEKGLGDIIDKFEKKVSNILHDSTKMNNLENFLHKVRSRMEEALQSNETIDIFQNDFELSRIIQSDNAMDKKNESQVEVRSFRDNLLAGKF